MEFVNMGGKRSKYQSFGIDKSHNPVLRFPCHEIDGDFRKAPEGGSDDTG